MEIRTERLLLREIEEADEVFFREMYADPEVCRYLLQNTRKPETPRRRVEEAMRYQSQEPRVYFSFMLVKESTQEVIGGSSIYLFPALGTAIFGWELMQAYWNQGFATEITEALLNFGFREQEVRFICADSFSGNKACHRVLQKCGFVRQKPIVNAILLPGLYQEWGWMRRYAITRERWEVRQREKEAVEKVRV